MHDPMSVAWEIKRPWPKRMTMSLKPWWYWPALVTVWHVDPEVNGNDSSCFLLSLVRKEPEFRPAREPWITRLEAAAHPINRTVPWQLHVWHYRIQLHFWQAFRRWMWSRCAGCGRRFRWGYSPVTNSWYPKRVRFWESESDVWHSDCIAPPTRRRSPDHD